MPFGADLLDRQREIEEYGAAGAAAIARLGEYIRRRAAAAEEHARALAKIGRHFSPAGPHEIGLCEMLARADDALAAHAALAHDTVPQLLDALRDAGRAHAAERAKALADIQRLRDDYARMTRQIERLKDRRAAAILDAEEAKHAFLRVNYDRNASRAAVERLRDEKERRAGKALVAKQEFIDGARSFAQIRDAFYGRDLPAAFDRLQGVEEARIAAVQAVLADFCAHSAAVLSDEAAHLQALVSHWAQTPPAEVVEHFVEGVRGDAPFAFPEGDVLALDDDEDAAVGPADEPASRGIALDARASSRAARRAEAQRLKELLAGSDPLPMRARLAELQRDEQLLRREEAALLRLSGINAASPELSDHDTNEEVARQMADIKRALEDAESDKARILARLASLDRSAAGGEALIDCGSPGDDSGRSSGTLSALGADSVPAVRPRPAHGSCAGTGRRVMRARSSSSAFAMLPAETQHAATSPSSTGTTLGSTAAPDDAAAGHAPKMEGASLAGAPAPQAQGQTRGAFQARVLFDFDAAGRTAGEMSVRAGELLTIHTHDDEWWQAENAAGAVGYVPHNYVAPLPQSLGMC